MEFKLTPYNRNTSEEEMISDVISVANKLNKKTVTLREYEVHGRYSPTTITRKLGSWFQVLERCQLNPSRSKINIPELDLFQNIENV
jgi:hypothetical protein